MQLHLPNFSWDLWRYAFAAFKLWGTIYFMQLQSWSSSEAITHKLGGGGVHGRKWNHLSLWRFFPCFMVFFAQKLAIFPLKRSVLDV